MSIYCFNQDSNSLKNIHIKKVVKSVVVFCVAFFESLLAKYRFYYSIFLSEKTFLKALKSPDMFSFIWLYRLTNWRLNSRRAAKKSFALDKFPV